MHSAWRTESLFLVLVVGDEKLALKLLMNCLLLAVEFDLLLSSPETAVEDANHRDCLAAAAINCVLDIPRIITLQL